MKKLLLLTALCSLLTLTGCVPKDDTVVEDEFLPRETVEMEAVDEIPPKEMQEKVTEEDNTAGGLFAEEESMEVEESGSNEVEVELEPMFDEEGEEISLELEPMEEAVIAEEIMDDESALLEEATNELYEKVAPRKVATIQGDQISIRYFYDYAAPNVAQIEDLIARLGGQFGSSVLWIYRPLGNFGSSGYAAKASECGIMQGAWPDFHDWLVALEGNVTEKNVKGVVRNLGLDELRFDSCMADTNIDKRLEHYQKEANDLNIESTPAFVIGEDVVFSGNFPAAVFEQMIQSLLNSRFR